MIRAYKFLMRPTAGQAQALGEMLRDHCSLYNGALQERRDAYRHPSKTSIYYGMQSAQLKDIRAFDPERQGRWSFSSQQATLRRLDKAMQAFFRRAKSGDTPGYPRFRGANWFDTVEFPKDGAGCRWDATPHDPGTRVRLQGVGHVKVNQHRAVVGKIKTVSVKREGRKWFVVLTAEQGQPEPLPVTGSVVGIDLGIANFLADSNGGFVPNPRHARTAAAKLKTAQQALSRFPRARRNGRTSNHRRAAEKVATVHRKVRRQRLDHAHKTALALVREHDVIAYESLKIRNMSKAPKPKPDPDQSGAFLPNGAAAKAGLNRSISDAGWGVFLTILHAKAESAGREVIAVDPRNTSRTCPECGHVSAENRPTQEKFRCVSCDHQAHADTVGALNVLRAGLVRREATSASEKPPRSRGGGVTNRTLAVIAAITVLALAGCSSSSTDPKAAPSSSAPRPSATFTLPADGPSQLAPQKTRDAAAAILRASTQHYRDLLAEGQTAWGTPAFGPWSQKAMKDLSDMAAFTKADKQFTADNEPASISDWRDDMGTVESAINEWAAKNTLETSDKASMPPATEVSKALATADADIAKVVAGK